MEEPEEASSNSANRENVELYFHDAFISYSRKDKPFAVMLERELRRYTPPRGLSVPRRRLNIFRDEEDFTGIEYYQAVNRHLQGSRKLVIICSPNARASSFVNDEIRRFTQVHSAEDLIPVLIAGNPETTNPANDADLAFPTALLERSELPLAADYRGFDPKSSSLRSPRYRTAWYKLLADICNCSRAEIEGREERRKFWRRMQSGVGVVGIFAVLLSQFASERLRLLVFVVGIFAVLLSQFASLLAVGKALGHLLRRPSASRISGPIYAPDSFAITGRVDAVDRSGRPLPWRWERSLSRDLLGQYGWVAATAAVVIAALVQTVPNTPNGFPTPPKERVPTTQTPPTASETAGRKSPENAPGSPTLPDRPNIENPSTGPLLNMK
jgi:hypothetical protein